MDVKSVNQFAEDDPNQRSLLGSVMSTRPWQAWRWERYGKQDQHHGNPWVLLIFVREKHWKHVMICPKNIINLRVPSGKKTLFETTRQQALVVVDRRFPNVLVRIPVIWGMFRCSGSQFALNIGRFFPGSSIKQIRPTAAGFKVLSIQNI